MIGYYQQILEQLDDPNTNVDKISNLVSKLPLDEASRLMGMLRKYKEEPNEKNYYIFKLYIERKLETQKKDSYLKQSLTKDGKDKAKRHNAIIVLDNIRSAFNVGSIIRSAEAFGFSKIMLYGYTAGVENKDVLKASKNCESELEIQNISLKDLENYKSNSNKIIGIETHKNAQILHQENLDLDSIYIVGNERFGISQDLYPLIDSFIKLPMLGNKASLNVANAFSIAAYELVRKNGLI